MRNDNWLAPLYDPRIRGLVLQALLVLAVVFLGYEIVTNTAANLRKQNIASGFGFLDRPSGFDVSQTLVPYSHASTNGRVFWVGLANTLLVAVLGIALSTVLGLLLGIARLSTNWIISRLALVYVETVRNVPLLLQLFLWYEAVLRALPWPAEALALPLGGRLDNRGIHLPAMHWQAAGGLAVLVALVGGIAASFWLWHRAETRRLATGEATALRWPVLGLVVGLPLAVFVLAGRPVSFAWPALGRYNFEGGWTIEPELVALVVGLTVYTAAFIGEIVRSGIAGVPRGQREAAAALGLRPGQAMRLVILPQAMRIAIPPLTNQYLNLTKNSSLAVAIGYPDLVSVFAGTVLNQTGQAVEVILVTMAVYLALSLVTSLAMNHLNARFALTER
jgi:general L-amino acid transport system permease protein